MNEIGETTGTEAAEIESRLATWSEAIRQRDLDALANCYVADVRVFDLGTQLAGFSALRALWESCLPYFPGEILTERRDLKVEVGESLAVATFFCRLTGMQSDHVATRAWMRTTVCFKKQAGHWRIFHDHVSMPLDCGAEKPLYILDETSLL